MKKIKNLNKQTGITLIALIITIIVLLILAGVTISILTGENGILNRAVSAREKTSEAEAKEKFTLQYSEFIISATTEGRKVGEYIENLSEEQLKKLQEDGIIVKSATSFVCDGYNIDIDSNGKIINCYKAGVIVNIYKENNKIKVEVQEISEKVTKIEVIKGDTVIGNIEIQDGTGTYETTEDGLYTVKVTTENNAEITKELKIDTKAPEYSELKIEAEGQNKIRVSLKATDNFSGISKVKIYYKKTTEEEYKVIEKLYSLELEKQINEEIGNLETGTDYNVYIEIYDDSNNMVTTKTDEDNVYSTQEDLGNLTVTEGLVDYWPLKSNLKNLAANSDVGNLIPGDNSSTMNFEDESVVISGVGLKSSSNYQLPDEFTFSIDVKFNTIKNSMIWGLYSVNGGDLWRSSGSQNCIECKSSTIWVYNGKSRISGFGCKNEYK